MQNPGHCLLSDLQLSWLMACSARLLCVSLNPFSALDINGACGLSLNMQAMQLVNLWRILHPLLRKLVLLLQGISMAAELPEELLSAVEALKALAARADKAVRKAGCGAEAASQHRCFLPHLQQHWQGQPLASRMVLQCLAAVTVGLALLSTLYKAVCWLICAGLLPPWRPGCSCTSWVTRRAPRQTQPMSWRAFTGTPLQSLARRVCHPLVTSC